MGAKVELKGSFEPLLKGFTNKTERGILRGTLRRTAQQVILKAAKANLKDVGARRYVKNLTVKTSVTNQVAGARIGAKKGSPLGKIGHLIEGGTRPHLLRPKSAQVMVSKDGIFRGRSAMHPGTRSRPWLNPALNDNIRQAVTRFGQLIVEEIDKAIAKGKR